MRGLALLAFAVLAGNAPAQPTSATRADSGWVPLFNGTDFTGLYDYASGMGIVDVKSQANFTIEAGGIIHVKGSPAGFLGTVRQYSHYRVHVDFQWPVGTVAEANSGLIIHIDSAAMSSGFKSAGRPRSIEVNCRRDGDFPWSLWSAAKLGPYISTKVTSIPASGVQGQYNPAGVDWTDDPYGTGNSRVVSGDFQPNPELPLGEWNHGEADVYGDSGVFILNGQVRTRGWGFRLGADGSGPASRTPCTRGSIALQSEGYPISFRNFEIMELDPVTNIAIHARRGCTQRASANYDPRAVADDGSCSGTALLRPDDAKDGGHRIVADPFGRSGLAFPQGLMRERFFDASGRLLFPRQEMK